MSEDLESKFTDLYNHFQIHSMYGENKTSRGRTFSGKYLQARHELTLQLISFVEKNAALLLTSTDLIVREKAENTLNRPNLLIENPDKNFLRLYPYSARRDIEDLYSRSFRYFFRHHLRGPRFVCLTENIYQHIKQQLEKRHWEVGPYFKDVKSFAKYVKAREQPHETSSEQNLQASTNIHVNSLNTSL